MRLTPIARLVLGAAVALLLIGAALGAQQVVQTRLQRLYVASPWTAGGTNVLVEFASTAAGGGGCTLKAGAAGLAPSVAVCDIGAGQDAIVNNRLVFSPGTNPPSDGNKVSSANNTRMVLLGQNGWGLIIPMGYQPTCTGCGTDPTINGMPGGGRVVLGAAPSAALVLTFPAQVIEPICQTAYNQTTHTVLQWDTTTTTITLTGTFAAGNVVAWLCLGIDHF